MHRSFFARKCIPLLHLPFGALSAQAVSSYVLPFQLSIGEFFFSVYFSTTFSNFLGVGLFVGVIYEVFFFKQREIGFNYDFRRRNVRRGMFLGLASSVDL